MPDAVLAFPMANSTRCLPADQDHEPPLPGLGAGVQSVGNCITVGLSDCRHGCSFMNVLADKAVEVLIASSFPRVARGWRSSTSRASSTWRAPRVLADIRLLQCSPSSKSRMKRFALIVFAATATPGCHSSMTFRCDRDVASAICLWRLQAVPFSGSGTSQEPCRLRHGEDIALKSGRPGPTLKG